MLKKMVALAAAAVMALTLAACGGTGEQLPALVLESESSTSQTSGVESGEETSGVESGSEEAQVETVPDSEFPDSLDGLCDYLTANSAVAGEPTEMAYETIGATGGYRFRFTLDGSTVQVEVYSFDLDNLSEQGQEVLSSVRENGSFALLDNEVPATLNSDGKYLMIYTDNSANEGNTTQKERVLELFAQFKAE